MQDYAPKKPAESAGVNVGIPGAAERRWVVAVLNFGPWQYQRYGREPKLVRLLDPKTGEAASRYDSETWADLDRTRNACGTNRFQDEMHEMLIYRNRPVFADDESRLRFADGGLVLEDAGVA
ncbi:MAG: hypothetical protein AVDCRST_MAG93-1075 [uncultured Chloroflexia bacterium]|uniref:Uncharacterized protein n=1 Tax=uncultured Chloroflexia bacterium TaxID=1672391 RepID=A0A6J4HXB9_9CHLR|nr:MAG: hypothetical protein AVDCRST_MAG93-1075 [uncultured Chloroflexia bacterium]